MPSINQLTMAGRRFDSQTCTMAVLHSLQEMSGMERNHLHGQPDVWDALVFPLRELLTYRGTQTRKPTLAARESVGGG